MDGTQYTELIEFLGERFGAIDKRFDQIDARFIDVDGRFEIFGVRMDNLATEISDLANRVSTSSDRIDQTLAEISELRSGVEGYVVDSENVANEQLAMAHRIDRHERWINQIAAKTGAKLSTEH